MADFDWVTALSECSTAKVFQELIMQAKADVELRKALLPRDRHYSFDVAMNGGDLRVFVIGNRLNGLVNFSFKNGEIVISNEDDGVMFTATPTLNDEGACRLRVNGKQCELWQVRKMALEQLFFKNY